jgi:hypothetical protein
MDCCDAPVSITEIEMTKLVKETRRIEKIFGQGKVMLTDAQKPCEQFRRPTNI